MITWGFMVAASAAGETRAAVILCPDDRIVYAGLAARFRAAGLKAVNSPLWSRFALDVTTCLVTVEGKFFTEIHTGKSRLTAAEPQSLSPSWLTAARNGRVVLALVPPKTLPEVEVGPGSSSAEVWGDRLDRLAAVGELLTGFATVIDKPAPAAGSGTVATRM
jgi:hypothetical protein